MDLLSFAIGLLVGGSVGISLMVVLFVSRESRQREQI